MRSTHSTLRTTLMNSFVDDIDDSLMLAALAQVESSLLAKKSEASLVPTAVALPQQPAQQPPPPRSFENLTLQHLPRNCKCGKPASVKVVMKTGTVFVFVFFFFQVSNFALCPGSNNGKRFYSCANQTCGFFDWVTAAHRLPPLAVSSTSNRSTHRRLMQHQHHHQHYQPPSLSPTPPSPIIPLFLLLRRRLHCCTLKSFPIRRFCYL
jgi:hypothetical protein